MGWVWSDLTIFMVVGSENKSKFKKMRWIGLSNPIASMGWVGYLMGWVVWVLKNGPIEISDDNVYRTLLSS